MLTKCMSKQLILVLCIFALLPFSAWASELQNEQFLLPWPQGYKIGYTGKKSDRSITKYVLENETIENHSKILTVITYWPANSMDHSRFLERLGGDWSKVDPSLFLEKLGKDWSIVCKNGTYSIPVSGKINNYMFSKSFMTCPASSTTGKPENTLMRIIKGNDSVYNVQIAFKFNPTKVEIDRANKYLDEINVCDTRSKEHPCPQSKLIQGQQREQKTSKLPMAF